MIHAIEVRCDACPRKLRTTEPITPDTCIADALMEYEWRCTRDTSGKPVHLCPECRGTIPPVETPDVVPLMAGLMIGVCGDDVMFLRPVTGAMPRGKALTIAATIVALGDPDCGAPGGLFRRIFAEVVKH